MWVRLIAPARSSQVLLRRSIDNRTANFTFGADGDLDTGAIEKWCAGTCETFVDTWYDQSPNKWHATNITSKDFHGDPNHNQSIADQPQLIIVPIGASFQGKMLAKATAHIHFDGHRRMDAKSPIAGNTGQTLLTIMSTTGTAVNNSDRLLSWAFVQNVVFPSARISSLNPTLSSLNPTLF
jgi:hypothetical protein